MQKQFICGWWEMIKEKHKLTPANALLWVSFILFIFTIIGIIIATNSNLHIISWILFGILCLCYLWYFFIQIPSEMFQKVRVESKDLLDLRNIQKTVLLQKNVVPQQYINFYIRRVYLYNPQNDTPYAKAEIYLSNATLFDLDCSLYCGRTRLNINHRGEHLITSEPKIKASFDKLNKCTLNNQIEIEQILNKEQLKELWFGDKHTLVDWTFEIRIKYSGEIGQSLEQIYHPNWEGEHFTITEVS